jgi:hypothetical protein
VHRSTKQAWNDRARTALACAVFAVCMAGAGVRAAEKSATNIDLMQDLTAQVVKELHAKFGAALAGRAVQLKPASTSEDYYFVTNVFREELMKAGVRVIEPAFPLSAPATPPPASAVTPAGTAQGNTGAAQPSTSSTAWTGTHTQAAPQTPPQTAAPDTSSGAQGEPPAAHAYVLEYQNVVFNVRYVDSHRSWVVGGKRVERAAAVRINATLTDPADGRVVWVGEAARDSSDEIDYGKSMQIEQGNYAFNKPVVPSAGWGKYVEPVFVTGIIVGLIYLFFSNQSNN